MARWLYTLLWWLLLPWLPIRLRWRGRREPGYRRHVGERFGFYRLPRPERPLIWLHAVSVGETRAAAPLVAALARRYPGHVLLITHMTATGRETAQTLFGDRAIIATLPYDLPFAMRRFLRHFRPVFGVVMETEVWPNLCHEAVRAGMPLYLANARLSEKSARGYARFSGLIRPALASFAAVATQSTDDADRLSALGARQVSVCGNTKFDVTPPEAQRELGSRLRSWLGTEPVWLFASSRDGEERLLLDALKANALPRGTRLVIVPRHPQRFDEVFDLLAASGRNIARRSQTDLTVPLPNDIDTVLGDSMGELFAWYAASDLALIGGSLAPLGGQNLIEAAAMGCPVLLGPHMFNFAEATRLALEAGAARSVFDAADAVVVASVLLGEPEELSQMREAALAFAAAHRGASERIAALLPDGRPIA